jgi:hypothetical protein
LFANAEKQSLPLDRETDGSMQRFVTRITGLQTRLKNKYARNK